MRCQASLYHILIVPWTSFDSNQFNHKLNGFKYNCLKFCSWRYNWEFLIIQHILIVFRMIPIRYLNNFHLWRMLANWNILFSICPPQSLRCAFSVSLFSLFTLSGLRFFILYHICLVLFARFSLVIFCNISQVFYCKLTLLFLTISRFYKNLIHPVCYIFHTLTCSFSLLLLHSYFFLLLVNLLKNCLDKIVCWKMGRRKKTYKFKCLRCIYFNIRTITV